MMESTSHQSLANFGTIDSRPEFVSPLEERYICLVCKEVLLDPVQTPCGHRLCKVCCNDWIQKRYPPLCPAKEEDCFDLDPESVCPDFSTGRELLRLPVFCTNRDAGCDEELAWIKLKNHVENDCQYKNCDCPNSCRSNQMADIIENHLEIGNNLERNNEELEIIKDEILKLIRHKREIENRLEQLETRSRDLMTSTANNAIQIEGLSNAIGGCLRKAEFEKHVNEMAKVKDAVDEQSVEIAHLQIHSNKTHKCQNHDYHEQTEVQKRHERQLAILDMRVTETDLRMLSMESTNYNGSLLWKIDDYRRRKEEAVSGRTPSLYSQPFFTSRYGYRMCARAYLNGDGAGRGTHLSLFFVLMQGEYDNLLTWPFRQKVTLTLIDQETRRRHKTDTFKPDLESSSFQKPQEELNVASGCPLFARHEIVERPMYLKDDSIFIKVSVDTIGLLDI